MSEEDLMEAEIEWVNYAIAICPHCGSEVDVSTCDSGVFECVCGNSFFWNTVD